MGGRQVVDEVSGGVGEWGEGFERVAALDIGKRELVACVRTPPEGRERGRHQQVRTYQTLTPALAGLSDWLRCESVQLVVMEATGDYWKPVFYLLEASGLRVWLVNARSVKNVPGRPKTDTKDAVWLAKLAERGMCSPSLVHPAPIRVLRDLCRYRRTLVREQTRDKQRVEKLLEDAQIKLSSVISDIFGVSGRMMLDALAAGRRDPTVLAAMARGRMRGKIEVLVEAFTGHFADHHEFLLTRMLARIDAVAADIAALDARIEEVIAPFQWAVNVLDEVPGIGVRAAQDLIGEIGVDMTRFPTAGHLVSWAKFAPIEKSSAGRSKTATTGKGDPWLAATLGEIVAAAAKTPTFYGERYRRLSRRRGKRRAIVALGNSVLTTIWHLLSVPGATYHELGPGHHQRHLDLGARRRRLVHELEALTGQKVNLTPAA